MFFNGDQAHVQSRFYRYISLHSVDTMDFKQFHSNGWFVMAINLDK